MSYERIAGIPLHDVVISIGAWVVILGYYIYQLQRRHYTNRDAVHNMKENDNYYPYYFFHMREGWVRKNHLTGQGTANTTRDWLRVLIFFEGNAAVTGALISGYAVTSYKEDNSPEDNFQVIKIGVCGLICFLMFFLFLYSLRFGVQFHFLMNVKDVYGAKFNLKIADKIFHASFFYYAAGLRLYYMVIPLSAWMISSWLLLAVSPFYLLIVEQYDNSKFVENDLEDMYRGTSCAKEDDGRVSREDEEDPPPAQKGYSEVDLVVRKKSPNHSITAQL